MIRISIKLAGVLLLVSNTSAGAAVCNQGDEYVSIAALGKALSVWNKLPEFSGRDSIRECIDAEGRDCQVLAPLNWHANVQEGERVHLTWRISPFMESPYATNIRTIHIYSENNDGKEPFTVTPYTTTNQGQNYCKDEFGEE